MTIFGLSELVEISSVLKLDYSGRIKEIAYRICQYLMNLLMEISEFYR